MLIAFGGFLTWGGSPIVPEELTWLTLLTFPLFLATFWKRGFNMINIINISPVLSTFLEKVAKTGEMLMMLILFGGFDLGGFPHSPWGINMINIINISPVLATFWKKGELTWLTLLTFPLF